MGPAAEFCATLRVYFEDTDAAGVVYYANYLRFMERVRSDWLRAAGFDVGQLATQENLIFVVRSATLDFIAPARLSDLLEVSVSTERLGGVSLSVVQEVRRGAQVLCRGRIKLACLDASTMAPRPLPPALAREIEKWTKS